ncbi:hypothetical protein FS749_005772, partial [Ceratobasidium sp. UAMH 11750]
MSILYGHYVFTFNCKYDPEHCKTQRRKRQSTGSTGTHNLKLAVAKCSQHHALSSFDCYVVLCQPPPFHTVSDPLFIDIVHLLRPETSVPCPQTVSSDLTYIYNRLSTNVRESFQEIDTAMHLAIDGWSSPLTASFLGVIVFWRQGGKLWSSILDFIYLPKSHTGQHMAEKTLKCLDGLGVKNQ